MKYDLSILIPARNEEWLLNTIEDILKNKRGATEIIVGLDGKWNHIPIPQHPDLTIFYVPEAIGQRAITNQCCRLSQAKYVMKCDAHCAFDEGFDVKLMADMQDDWTVVPLMYNWHVFDWVCEDGHRRYMSPSGVCKECGKPTHKEVIWKSNRGIKTSQWRFDNNLHFQYWNDRKPEGDIVENMSLIGACWMLTRERYWKYNFCDEEHGSWGQQGTEIACKTWLTGGRLVCNKKTWFGHMFRTQGGDFSFPYPMSGKAQEKARRYSKDLWLNNKFNGVHPLSWLVEKFWPIPGWTDDDLIKIKKHDKQQENKHHT